jgi:hypothetical protein
MNSDVICSVRNVILVEKCKPRHTECPVSDNIQENIAYLKARCLLRIHSFSTYIKSLTVGCKKCGFYFSKIRSQNAVGK